MRSRFWQSFTVTVILGVALIVGLLLPRLVSAVRVELRAPAAASTPTPPSSSVPAVAATVPPETVSGPPATVATLPAGWSCSTTASYRVCGPAVSAPPVGPPPDAGCYHAGGSSCTKP